jgi:hypothetical protein
MEPERDNSGEENGRCVTTECSVKFTAAGCGAECVVFVICLCVRVFVL